METEYNFLFKYILVGESGVGKTSLINRFVDERYEKNHTATIGVDFRIKTINVGDNTIKLQIWDTAGHERFRTITKGYYRGAHCIIIVFDLTDLDSFLKIDSWIQELRECANENVEIIILGNKSDLEENIQVDRKSIETVLEENEIKKENYFDVSAKENFNVNLVFDKTAEKLVELNPQMKNINEPDEEEFEIKPAESKSRWFCF